MLNRTVSKFFQALMILSLVASLSACGYFGIGEKDDAEKSMEQMESSGETMESHAATCPHGGGACCEKEEPHPCCAHSEPESQPAE